MVDTREVLSGANWRLAGPFRGGRSIAAVGHPTEMMTFYFGACAGGVWKTTDGGATWRNVSDGYFRTASVGALAVAEADPNVIYAGMGESCIRGNVTHGDGVYRSDDGGASWRHCGLEDTRHIARVRVHPKNADIVYVAAFGHAFGPHAERGVYRSRDGGTSWEKVLYRDERTGACDLTMDPNNPRVLYAALWEAHRSPWDLVSGGEGSGIFKTTDGGDTWTELTDNQGLPKGLKGRIGISVSPARPERVWALIESKEGGLFRSDDGGRTWELLTDNPDLRQRPWYYMHIFADPVDPDTVYVLNLSMWKSTDGGKTFFEIPTPHGDNHDLWIDPRDTCRMIEANDGGACVSFNGGVTFSSIYNQPTAQLYHVITDNQFPYRIYGAQQDNSTICIPSYGDRGAITGDDTYPVGGGESGYIAIHPDNPNIVFAGSYATRMTRYDHASQQAVDITVWPDDPIGYGAESMRYRFQWTFPIILSPHNPDLLYVTGNHVFRSTTSGQQFEPISPDLTRGDPETLGPSGGPITKDNVSTEYYGTIFAFAESPMQAGVFWAGSDDGLVHVSRDGGASWQHVTPPQIPDWTLISIIEPSPHDPATAYLAANRYKMDDTTPYFLKTHDYGATWELITDGIRAGDFARVIREDPERKGLLYAGTETGLYVSWDDGLSWHAFPGAPLATEQATDSVRPQFPVVPVHDLIVHGSDLVVGTHGRSFWVLDDLTPIRQWSEVADDARAHLFPIRETTRILAPHIFSESATPGYHTYIHTGGSSQTALVSRNDDGNTCLELMTSAENPPIGVALHYLVRGRELEEITLSFHTLDGELIRSFSATAPTDDEAKQASDKDKDKGKDKDTDEDDKLPSAMRLKRKAGLHRFVWDMRYPDATKIKGAALSLYWGGSTIGPVVPPGEYEARLEVGGQEQRQQFRVVRDPRVTASDDDLRAQFDLLLKVRDKLGAVHDIVLRSRRLRDQLGGWETRLRDAGNAELADDAKGVAERLQAAEGELVESRSKGAADSFNFPPKVNSKLASLQSTISYGDSRPPQQTIDVFELHASTADENIKVLQQLIDAEVPALNAKIAKAGVPAIG